MIPKGLSQPIEQIYENSLGANQHFHRTLALLLIKPVPSSLFWSLGHLIWALGDHRGHLSLPSPPPAGFRQWRISVWKEIHPISRQFKMWLNRWLKLTFVFNMVKKAIWCWEADRVWSGVGRLVHLSHQLVRCTLFTLKTQLWGENSAKMYSRKERSFNTNYYLLVLPCTLCQAMDNLE